MSDESRAKSLVDPLLSPLVDRVGEGYVVTESTRKVLYLDRSRRHLLGQCLQKKQRCILVTGEHTALTRTYLEAMNMAGAQWVVRSRHGLRDALTGRRLHRVSEVLEAPEALELADEHARETGFESTILELHISLRQRNVETADYGASIEVIAEELLDEPELSWGSNEPAMVPWDGEELANWTRGRLVTMPHIIANAVGQDGRRLSATMQVRPTQQGSEEILSIAVDLGPTDGPETAERLEAAPDILGLVAEETTPLMATANARYGRADLLKGSTLEMPLVPMALMIGAPGVSSFQIDSSRLVEDFDAFTVGEPRMPGLVIGLGSTIDPANFQELREAMAELGPEKIAAEFGDDFLDSLLGPGWSDSLEKEAKQRREEAAAEGKAEGDAADASGEDAAAETADEVEASIFNEVVEQHASEGHALRESAQTEIEESTLPPPEEGWEEFKAAHRDEEGQA